MFINYDTLLLTMLIMIMIKYVTEENKTLLLRNKNN